MYQQAANPVWTRASADSIALALQTNPAAPVLPALTLKLFTAVSNPIGPNSVAGDFTEATFSGYAAAAALTFSAPVNMPSGEGAGLSGSAIFIANSGIVAPGQSVLGYFITNGAGTTLYMAEAFPAPVPFVNPGDFLELDVMLGIMWDVKNQ